MPYSVGQTVHVDFGEIGGGSDGVVLEVAPCSTCVRFADPVAGREIGHWFDTRRGRRLGDTADRPYTIPGAP